MTNRKADTILIADDEPYNLQWVLEFLHSLKYKTVTVETVDAAVDKIQQNLFRAVIADLSIPMVQAAGASSVVTPFLATYPGLFVADYARNHGHTGPQVIVYSVHDDPIVHGIAERLRCRYLLKGRPRVLKEELRQILSYDPLAKTT